MPQSTDSTATGATPGESQQQYIEDFRKAGHQAVEWIADYLANVSDLPVLPDVKPGELIDALPAAGPAKGENFENIFADFERLIMPSVTQWNHPRFFAYFACTGSTPAILGEMLAAALNTNGLHWKTSPTVAELEHVALGWLRQWMGLSDEWFGIVYDTASVSSMHAIACAREFVAPEARVEGSRADLILYTSEQAHSSIEKGAITVGLGQNNVRKVPVDAEFRMKPEALEALVQQDVAAGKRPCCVVATVGTTSTTSIDPLTQIAPIAEKYKMWLHVDAAYAGAAAILPEYRYILDGAERAHSLVVNAHKWLLTPIDLSAFYTRRRDILRRAFSLVPEYLHPNLDPRATDLMDYGVPLGHRFRALKLWFVLRYFGQERIQKILRSHIQLAQRFAHLVDADPDFERVAPTPFSIVCFRYKGTDEQNKKMLDTINATGRVFMSHTMLNGRVAVRLAIGNLATTWEDLLETWDLLKEAVRR